MSRIQIYEGIYYCNSNIKIVFISLSYKPDKDCQRLQENIGYIENLELYLVINPLFIFKG